MAVNTSRANVEALAERMERGGRVYTHTEAAALLRALLAERDEAREGRTAAIREMVQQARDAGAATAERDTWRARAERAEAELAECRGEMAEIERQRDAWADADRDGWSSGAGLRKGES